MLRLEEARYLLFDLEHAQPLLGKVVGQRQTLITYKAPHILAVHVFQSVQFACDANAGFVSIYNG